MSKIHTTKKELKNRFLASHTFCCGYCDLQEMDFFIPASYCTSGVYSWNFDTYRIGGDYLITTGYRGTFGKWIDNDTIKRIKEKSLELMAKWQAGEISRYQGGYILEEYICGLLCDLTIDK